MYIHKVPKEITKYDFDKVYVGITCRKPTIRWGLTGQNYKGQLFGKAIKKYGWENIIHEIVATNLTLQEASNMEIELIKQYKSNDSIHGYNIAAGGLSNSNSEYKKINLYDYNGKFIRTFDKMIELCKFLDAPISNIIPACQNHGLVHGYQVRYYDEVNNTNNITSYINHTLVPIFQFDSEFNFIKKWKSIVTASKEYDVAPSSVRSCCVQTNKMCQGFYWRYEKDIYYDENDIPRPILTQEQLGNHFKKSIYKFDHFFNFIKRFSSATDAEEDLGIKDSHVYISKACKAKMQAYDFYWVYENDVEFVDETYRIKDIYSINRPQGEVYVFDANTHNYISRCKNSTEFNQMFGFEGICIDRYARERYILKSKYLIIQSKDFDQYYLDINKIPHILKLEDFKQPKEYKIKKIYYFDTNKNFVRVYNNSQDVANDFGCSSTTIRRYAKHHTQNKYGYFRYKEDIKELNSSFFIA